MTAFVPFETDVNHQTLDRLKYHRFLLLVKSPNGMVKVLGSLDNPVQLSQAATSGEDPKDTAGTSLTFTWSTEDKPILYSGAISPVQE